MNRNSNNTTQDNLREVSRKCLLVASLMDNGTPAVNTICFCMRRSIEVLQQELDVYGYSFGDSVERGVGFENGMKSTLK